MERLRGSVQLGSIALGLALFSATTAATHSAKADGGAERASPAEVLAARELFRQATEDVDAGRFNEGLEKFKRVAAVRETAAVRFNIGRCEEALGKIGGALADFELAISEGRDDSKAQDVSKLAEEHADALRPKVPRLTMVAPASLPEGLAVSLDGRRLSSATLGVGLPLDPGPHVVEAVAPGRMSFHAELRLALGEAKNIDLVLPPGPPDASGAALNTSDEKASSPSHGSRGSAQRTWGWISLATGGVLGVGSLVFLVLERNATSSVSDACPDANSCSKTPEQQAAITSDEANAHTYQSVSIGLLIGAAVGVGAGVVLIATAPHDGTPNVSVTAGAPGAPAGLSLRAAF